jgi:hypothetical protein
MKKVLAIVAVVAALASVAGVSKGWKWNSFKAGSTTTQMADGWTWDGAQE